MQALFILNDPPYGTERCYNGLRLAIALARRDPSHVVTIFLMADAVSCAKKGQKTPEGYYNIERMVRRFATGGHRLLLCGACMDARALGEADLIEGAKRSSMDELATATAAADKVLVF
ncbi:MAG: DsrE family protein [Alphaproteobacteria bacterium]|nr:DsrE family protein [Alphaproteobacteria bacterium]